MAVLVYLNSAVSSVSELLSRSEAESEHDPLSSERESSCSATLYDSACSDLILCCACNCLSDS